MINRFRRYTESAVGIAFIIFFLALFVAGIGVSIVVIMECGWVSFLLGKGAIWAYLFGMCG